MNESINYQGVLYAALASVPAILVILWNLFQHNKRIEDIRDILRAEIKSTSSETLLKISDLSEQNKIAITKLSSVEEDLKRTLLNLDNLNSQSKDFIRELTENKIKLEVLTNVEKEQKINIKDISVSLVTLQKSTDDNRQSLNSYLKEFNERLIEIERYYTKKLTEIGEELKRNIDRK